MSNDPLAQRRIVLWCPYVHWYIAPTLASTVLGQMGSCKYKWFQQFMARHLSNVYVYCDAQHTSMVHYRGDALRDVADPEARKEFTLAEALRWNELNNFQIPRDRFLSQPSQIEPHDIVFTFSSFFLDQPLTAASAHTDLYKVFTRDDIFKVVHLTHYVFWMSQLSANLRLFKVNMLCYESNLAKYKFFRQHFPFVSSVTIIPFAIQDRFTAKTPFDDRINRCVATGGISFHKINPGLMEFFFEFSSNNFYPLRVLLAENATGLADYLHVKMGYYQTSMNDALGGGAAAPLDWKDLLGQPVETIAALGRQKKISYYSDDIVALYNTYRFSYVSEELQHAPALGFFESMACGAIPVGVESDLYRDIGLQSNVHYLPFDGTFGGLMKTLVFAYKNPNAVRHIPAQNEKLVRNFSESRIASHFNDHLTRNFQLWTARRQAAPVAA